MRIHTSKRTRNLPARIRIERIVPGGAGIGFADGQAILVEKTAPGDLVEVQQRHRGPLADLLEIIEAGPDRTEPVCPHASKCGGCDLMHVTYSAQIEAKRSIVLDAMKRTGHSDVTNLLQLVPNPQPLRSRIRATWHPGREGQATYLGRGSHHPVEIDECIVLDPALENVRSRISISNVVTGLTNGDSVSVTNKAMDAETLTFSICGSRIQTSADAFFQANGALLDSFACHVISEVSPHLGKSVWDLYGGVGLFSLPIARAGANVIAVETSTESVAFARRNAERAHPGSMLTIHSTVEEFLTSQHHPPEVVVIDPPRTGLSSKAANALVALKPGQIVSVSCDPATFARDHRLFVKAGYELGTLTAFDLYPQTHHVELVGAYKLGNR